MPAYILDRQGIPVAGKASCIRSFPIRPVTLHVTINLLLLRHDRGLWLSFRCYVLLYSWNAFVPVEILARTFNKDLDLYKSSPLFFVDVEDFFFLTISRNKVDNYSNFSGTNLIRSRVVREWYPRGFRGAIISRYIYVKQRPINEPSWQEFRRERDLTVRSSASRRRFVRSQLFRIDQSAVNLSMFHRPFSPMFFTDSASFDTTCGCVSNAIPRRKNIYLRWIFGPPRETINSNKYLYSVRTLISIGTRWNCFDATDSLFGMNRLAERNSSVALFYAQRINIEPV